MSRFRVQVATLKLKPRTLASAFNLTQSRQFSVDISVWDFLVSDRSTIRAEESMHKVKGQRKLVVCKSLKP